MHISRQNSNLNILKTLAPCIGMESQVLTEDLCLIYSQCICNLGGVNNRN
jgi:hypothetical protein